MQCQGHPATFFFNLFLKSHLSRFTGGFASIFSVRIGFFPVAVRAMPAAALAAVSSPAMVLFRENHQPLLIEVIIAGFQRQRFRLHAAKIRDRCLAGKSGLGFMRLEAVLGKSGLNSLVDALAFCLSKGL
ncbi:hypothetical protein [Rufibacter psychrotolerans]|uniref:hypothetical protein n=1 Tax=Rufibacter psychrotolerans TaxID=2812556 RepID=UPI004042055E